MTDKRFPFFIHARGHSESGGREVNRDGQKYPPYIYINLLNLIINPYMGVIFPPDSPPDSLPTRQKSREEIQKPPDSEGESGGGREGFLTPIYRKPTPFLGWLPYIWGQKFLPPDLPTQKEGWAYLTKKTALFC